MKSFAVRCRHLTRTKKIPGISKYLSLLIIQFLDLKTCKSDKQWIAFLGMDISVRQSGEWRGRGRISKRGSRYLRKRFFSAAWGAAMHDKYFRCLYDELKDKGRSVIQKL